MTLLMFFSILLCQMSEEPGRESRAVQRSSLGTAPFINKTSELGLCGLCIRVVVLGRLPPGISLAAELMSTSADDWAAFLSAADAGKLLCPSPDCFVVILWSCASICCAQSKGAH